MSIVAIDPGTSNTGLVYMDERRIIDAKTLHYIDAVKDDQDKLRARASDIAGHLMMWLVDKQYEAIVMEGFVNFTKRQSQYTFQTPYLCGYLHAMLGALDVPLVIQTSRQVLNPHIRWNVAEFKEAMAKGRNVWGDCSAITNDHTRSAAAHGIYYYKRKGTK